MLVYSGVNLIHIRYKNYDFQSNRDSRKFISGVVFTLGNGSNTWRSFKLTCVAESNIYGGRMWQLVK